jgi:hypothetical protein
MFRPLVRLPTGFSRPMDVRNETNSVALNNERAAVRSVGGTSNMRLNGPDGHTNGILHRPIEVKYANKDFRYRVGETDHNLMLRQDGLYVFINARGEKKQMSARDADRLIRYGWLSDKRSNGQDYRHSFIFVNDVF